MCAHATHGRATEQQKKKRMNESTNVSLDFDAPRESIENKCVFSSASFDSQKISSAHVVLQDAALKWWSETIGVPLLRDEVDARITHTFDPVSRGMLITFVVMHLPTGREKKFSALVPREAHATHVSASNTTPAAPAAPAAATSAALAAPAAPTSKVLF